MYKIGDRFTEKNTRDGAVLEVIGAISYPYERTYMLKYLFNDNIVVLGEEAVNEIYRKIN